MPVKNMERIRVKSSNLRSFGYQDGVLEVEFNNGRVYRYSGVPEGVVRRMLSAPSVGEYFAKHIREEYAYQEDG